MKKDAEIHIMSRRQYEGGQTDKTEQTFRGRFYRRDGRFYLHYKEPDRASVTLWAEPGRACVIQNGEFSFRMTFCPGQVLPSPCQTSFGTLNLDVATHSLHLNLTDQGGELEICYDLLSGGQIGNRNRLAIQVRPV